MSKEKCVRECSISIVIPVYRTDMSDLNLCLEGIKKQTIQPMEVLLVFDEGIEPYKQLLSSYCKQLNIKVLWQEHRGVSSARNCGIREAKGDYIFFHDSDDYLEADALLEMWKVVVNSAPEIVAAEYYCCIGKNRRKHCYKDKDCCFTEKREISGFVSDVLKPQTGAGFVWAKLFKRGWMEKYGLYFSHELAVAEDAEFMVRAAGRADCIYYLNFAVYNYRIHPDSAVRGYRRDYPERYESSLEKIKKFVDENEEQAYLEPALMNCIVYHLLLIAVNYSFHPDKSGSLREKIKEFSRLAEKTLFHEALKKVNCREFSMTRRITLLCIRLHFYFAVAVIAAVRHFQISKGL